MRFKQNLSFALILLSFSTVLCSTVGNLDNYYATNAAAPLDIPSYVQYAGVNEIVHPDVIYEPNGWHGYKYWMAHTPFPNNDATYENPCLAVSNDNVTWIDPPGLTNPVDSFNSSSNDYNSDPEILLSPDKSTMYMLWRRYKNNQFEKLYVRQSSDGITWTDRVEVLSTNPNIESLISPAVIYYNGQYMMWTVDVKPSPRIVRLRTASSIYGPWSSSTATDIHPLSYDTGGTALTETWHINVAMVGNEYWMIDNDTVMGGSNGVNLYLGNSNDGIHWTFANHPVLYMRNNYLYWDQKLYRACIIPVNDGQQIGFRLWYSVMRKATGTNPPWRIGYTEAWCAPKNTRMLSTRQDSLSILWDAFASVYLKSTYYKVQETATPFVEGSWQDISSWSSNLSLSVAKNANLKRFFRVLAKVE
ncbi:MAG TPA: hypothetical protein PLE74_08670 [Candidatus Cloacimonadota bacterium]|nr:hypothetical protein [Candidatus Cloacimonadota bacterium]